MLSTTLSLMASSLDGDSLKGSKMSVDEKRKLVHELSGNSDLAFQALQAWTREEILQVLCAELGKERKYKSWTKAKMINKLLKIVSEKKDPSPMEGKSESRKKTVSDGKSGDQEDKKRDPSTAERNPKKRRKSANPTRHVAPTSSNASGSTNSAETKGKDTTYCNNLACRAILRRVDLFCKRCSCCICYKYDDNKDTSLWLTCNSDPPFAGESCGLSCHLDCAFKSEKSGLKEDKPSNNADGCFYCVSCGKINSLLECLKKQLLVAKETERVSELCRRLVLAQKLLKGTEKHRELSETVEEAVKSLETELDGPLTLLPSAKCKGIINRLSSAPKVKNLCSSALESLQDSTLEGHALPCKVQAAEYCLQVVSFSGGKDTSVDETKVSTITTPQEQEGGEKEATLRNSLSTKEESCVDETKVSTKTTPQEQEEGEEKATLVNSLSTREEEKQVANGKNSASCGFGLEHCVKIMRELERSGYVDKKFRENFLTWYGLKATAWEIKIVKIFIDAFGDDSKDLSEQLIHTFSDYISRNSSANESAGFCMKHKH